MYPFLLLYFCFSALALEVIKYEPTKQIQLRIIRAEPESFETWSLMNHNGREMTLVCARNRVYDNNPKPFIEYRNFYNEIAGTFELESELACRELAKFIENVHSAISEEHPFVINLNTKTKKVDKIVYPKVDPYTDKGHLKDLLPKAPVGIEVNPAPVAPARKMKVKKPQVS